MPVGMALAMLAGPLFEDWRIMWWASAAVSLSIYLLVPVVIPLSGDRKRWSWRKLTSDAAAVFNAGGAVGLALAFGLYSLMFFALFSFLPVLLMDRMGVSHQTAGFLSALASAVILLLSPMVLKLLGTKGTRALERLMGLLLILVAVQMFLDGVSNYSASSSP